MVVFPLFVRVAVTEFIVRWDAREGHPLRLGGGISGVKLAQVDHRPASSDCSTVPQLGLGWHVTSPCLQLRARRLSSTNAAPRHRPQRETALDTYFMPDDRERVTPI
jgi:hypothetical protein